MNWRALAVPCPDCGHRLGDHLVNPRTVKVRCSVVIDGKPCACTWRSCNAGRRA